MQGLLAQTAATPAAAIGSAAWIACACAMLGLPLPEWAPFLCTGAVVGAVAWLDSLFYPRARSSDDPFWRAAVVTGCSTLVATGAALSWLVLERRSLLSLPDAKDVALAAMAVGVPCGLLASASGTAFLRVLSTRS